MLETRRKTALFFLLGALMASAAAYLFINSVAQAQAELGAVHQVLVAARPIPALTPIREGDLTTRPVAANYRLPGLLSDPEEVLGHVAIAPLAEGEPLLAGLIQPPDRLDPHERVLSLVTGERVVAEPGLIPGDRVDILASHRRADEDVTEVYLENVPVVAVREGEDRQLISLRVSLEEARQLVYIRNYGHQLHLLRRPMGRGEGTR